MFRKLFVCLPALCVHALTQKPIELKTPHDVHDLTRRAVVGGFISGVLLVAPSPSRAVLDARGNQLSGLSDRTGDLDQTPFSAVVDGVRKALEAVGVEKDQPKPLKRIVGPPVERDFEVGRRPGSDRLQRCPPQVKEGSNERCVSSADEQGSSTTFVAPFVYFAQKGEAVGKLLEFLYDTPRWSLLASDGNFFNGQGVYVISEYSAPSGQVFDLEFSFLPSVLESTVDVRVVERTSPPPPPAGGDDGERADSVSAAPVTARSLAASMGRAMAWVPLRVDPFSSAGSSGGGGGGAASLDASFAKTTASNYRAAVDSSEAYESSKERRSTGSSSSSSSSSSTNPSTKASEDDEQERAEIYQQAAVEWRIRGAFEKEIEAADAAIAAQMEDEQKRVAALKSEINNLLDQLQRQDDLREAESRKLRKRVADTREAYYAGILKRQGSYRNSGTYSNLSRQSAGASIGTSINKDEGVTTRILGLGRNKID